MKKLLAISFSILCVLFISCQKEIDWGLAPASDKLLVRTISKSPTDSTVTDYFYNSNKQLVQETLAIFGAANSNNDLKIYRNGSGIVTRTKQVSSTLQAQGVDSVITTYTYNTATSRYSYSLMSFTVGGTTLVDSTVFIYNASGKITADEHYLTTGIIPPFLSLKNQYTYSIDGLDLTGVQQSAATIPGGPLSTVSTQIFTYDSKKSPLILKEEGIVLLRPNYFSSRNTAKVVFSNTLDPTQDFTMDQAFTYNTSNKPDSATATRTPGGAITKSKYFYQ